MSEIVDSAVEKLSEKLGGRFEGGTVKLVIEGEGEIVADGDGVRAASESADVTLTADADTLRGLLSGEVNPTSAFMQGRLSVDGDMALAMKLGSSLA